LDGRRFLKSHSRLGSAASQVLRELLFVSNLRDILALTLASGHLVVIRVDVAFAHVVPLRAGLMKVSK
jgi:hypothetical protein